MKLSIELTDEQIAAIAERVAELIGQNGNEPDGWLSVAEAAEYLRCPRSRIYTLVSARRIPYEKDGSRTLFRRSELDAWVREGGGIRP